jgi:energy-coupling factor transport system permease protein
MDRALDVAATLEVRGYGSARRGGMLARSFRPWSRHDRAFMVSAVALIALTVAARVVPVAAFDPYPEITGAGAGEALLVAVVLATVALLPFVDRRGIAP